MVLYFLGIERVDDNNWPTFTIINSNLTHDLVYAVATDALVNK